jgi:uncharacterized metal-binding protein YceD (DUF177 family)
MGQIDDRIVRFSGLKPGVYAYSFTLEDKDFKSFENEELKGGKVNFDVKMERLERMLLFTFSFTGEVTTYCDRCLGEIKVGVNGEEHLSVRFSDNEESDNEDEAVLPESATEIDLTQWLYEYVAVRMPLQHTHADGECDPEVTKYIGEESDKPADDYVDPRWEALKELK